MGVIQVLKIIVGNVQDFSFFQCLNVIAAGILENKASKGNYKLIFGEKENVSLFLHSIIVIINSEYAFGNNAQILTNNILFIVEIIFGNGSLMPKRQTHRQILVGELGKAGQYFL